MPILMVIFVYSITTPLFIQTCALCVWNTKMKDVAWSDFRDLFKEPYRIILIINQKKL